MSVIPRRSPRDDGFTLIELLVVVVILGVVGTVVGSAIVSAMRSAQVSTARVEATQELEIALQRVTRDLRAADPLILSEDDEFEDELGASIVRGGDRTTVFYRLLEIDGRQQLVHEDTGRTLVSFVDNGDEPLFRYLDRFGEEIVCTTTCSSAYLKSAQIEIRLVRIIDDRAPIRVTTRVSVRAIRYGET